MVKERALLESKVVAGVGRKQINRITNANRSIPRHKSIRR